MKKVMIALMMAVTTSTACFANASNDGKFVVKVRMGGTQSLVRSA